MGQEYQLIIGEIVRRHLLAPGLDVQRRMRMLRGGKDGPAGLITHGAIPLVAFPVPLVQPVRQQKHPGLIAAAGQAVQSLRVLVNFAKLLKTAIVPAVIIQNAMPVHFRSIAGRPPAEVADIIRAVGNGLHCPQPHLSGQRHGAEHHMIPAVSATLLLHNGEIRGEAPHGA